MLLLNLKKYCVVILALLCIGNARAQNFTQESGSEIKKNMRIANSYYATAKQYRETNQFDSAAYYADRGVEYMTQNHLDNPELLIDFSDILTQTGRPKRALTTLLYLSERKNLDSKLKSIIHANLGDLFSNVKSYQLAVENYKDAIKNFEGNTIHIYYWYGNIGRSFLDLNLQDSARVYFREQLKWALRQESSKHEVALALNNIGFAFIKEENPDSGVYYYQKSIGALQEGPMSAYDLLLYSNLQVNIGNVLFETGEADMSLPYLINAYKYSTQKGYKNQNVIETGLALFRTHLQLQQFQEAAAILDDLSALEEKTELQDFEIIKRKLLLSLSDSKRSIRPEELRKYLELSDRLRKAYDQNAETNVDLTSEYLIKLATVENELNKTLMERAQAQLRFSERRKKDLQIWIVLIAIIFILVTSVIYFYINSKRKQTRLRNEILEKDKDNLEYELKLTEQDLTNFAINLNIKKEQNEEILDLLTEVKKMEDSKIKPGLDRLIKDVKSRMNSEKTLNKFEENFEQVNAKFFDKLNELYPTLTRYEREFCAMVRLNLNNKEIASLKGISLNSAKVSKYRLKKKLNLSEQEDIALYLQKL